MRRSNPVGAQNPIVVALFTAADGAGLTPKDMAAMMGVHPNTIQNWRHGRVNPSIVDAVMMAEQLGMRISIGAPA